MSATISLASFQAASASQALGDVTQAAGAARDANVTAGAKALQRLLTQVRLLLLTGGDPTQAAHQATALARRIGSAAGSGPNQATGQERDLFSQAQTALANLHAIIDRAPAARKKTLGNEEDTVANATRAVLAAAGTIGADSAPGTDVGVDLKA